MNRRGTQTGVAQHGDAEAVWPLVRQFATSFTPRREAFDAAWDALIADPAALVLIARTEASVVGYLLAHTSLTFLANGSVAWIEEIMVAPDHRGTGVGRQLMTQAETWARLSGAAYVALASRRAIAFYVALDYEESATFFRKVFGRQ